MQSRTARAILLDQLEREKRQGQEDGERIARLHVYEANLGRLLVPAEIAEMGRIRRKFKSVSPEDWEPIETEVRRIYFGVYYDMFEKAKDAEEQAHRREGKKFQPENFGTDAVFEIKAQHKTDYRVREIVQIDVKELGNLRKIVKRSVESDEAVVN